MIILNVFIFSFDVAHLGEKKIVEGEGERDGEGGEEVWQESDLA